MHLSKATRNPKITLQHLQLRPVSASLHLPVQLQLQAEHSTADTSPRCFQSPALCDARTSASSPTSSPDTGCFPPTSQAESLLCPVRHNFPAMGPNLLPSQSASTCTVNSHPPSTAQPAITRPVLSMACQTVPPNSRKSTVTTHTTTHSEQTGPPFLHTAAHGPPEPCRVRKRGC